MFIFSLQIKKPAVTNFNPAGTWRTGDILWRSPKGRKVRGLQGTNTEIVGLMRKLFFRNNSLCITYLFLFFYRKNKYSKVLNRDVHGTSTGPSYGTFRGSNDGTFWGRRSSMFLKFNARFLNSNWTYFDRLLKTLKWMVVAINSVNSILVKKT